MIGYGWLGRLGLPAEIDGVAFDPSMPTRREEFTLVRDVAKAIGARTCFDAGSGKTPHQHVMPLILLANGCATYAVDDDPYSAEMPSPKGVVRLVEDMTRTSVPDASCDLVCCVSVLEHVPHWTREGFAKEARRTCRPGGYLVVTADEMEPRELAGLFSDGFETGKEKEMEDGFRHLGPRVGYVIARRI